MVVRVGFRIGVRGDFGTGVMGGCRRRVTVGVMGGLNASLRKTRKPVFWRIERTTSWTPIIRWGSGAK